MSAVKTSGSKPRDDEATLQGAEKRQQAFEAWLEKKREEQRVSLVRLCEAMAPRRALYVAPPHQLRGLTGEASERN